MSTEPSVRTFLRLSPQRVAMSPWDVALRMMRNGRDSGLIVAYLEEEARLAGVDPLDLSMHISDVLARKMRPFKEAWRQFGAACAAARETVTQP